MYVYAHPKDAFDERAEHIGELFAVPAAIAVQNPQILAQTQRLAANLQAALTSRAVIDQAIGIIISRTGVTPRGGLRTDPHHEPGQPPEGLRGRHRHRRSRRPPSPGAATERPTVSPQACNGGCKGDREHPTVTGIGSAPGSVHGHAGDPLAATGPVNIGTTYGMKVVDREGDLVMIGSRVVVALRRH
jgi:hypothetical protein